MKSAVAARGRPRSLSMPAQRLPADAAMLGAARPRPTGLLAGAGPAFTLAGGPQAAPAPSGSARAETAAALGGRPPPSVPSQSHAVGMGALAYGLGGALGGWFQSEDFFDEIAAARADIEIRGRPRFEPNWRVGRYIEKSGSGGAKLRAHFGTLAAGHIVIRADDRGYQADSYFLSMQHPGLVPRNKGTEVGLVVWIEDSVFHGMLGTAEPGRLQAGGLLQVSEEGLRSIIFGRSYQGPENLKEDTWKNQLIDGHLNLLSSFRLQPPDGPSLTGSFFLFGDDEARFGASGPLVVEGAETSSLEVRRTPAGILSGHPKLAFNESWKGHGFKGGFEASFFDGTFEARGQLNITYPEERPFIKGNMNVVATSPERAWAAANANDPSPHLTGGIERTNRTGTGLALVAWGRLDLILAPGSPAVGPKAKTEPLIARALFLVDPGGDITARGILRMPSHYVLVPAYQLPDKPLLDPARWHLAGGDVFPGVGGDIWAFAQVTPWAGIGPFSLRDLVADGTYSTREDIGSEIKLAGSFNASAAAGLKAEAGVEAVVTIGIHTPWPLPDITVDAASFKAGFAGEAVIRGYIDARPEIKVKREPKSERGAQPLKYSIHGDLHVAGQIIVKLGASIGYQVPNLASNTASAGAEYTLATGGISVTIDHEFGSDKLPEYKFDKIDFDPRRFVRDMRSGGRPTPGGDKKPHGEFRERDASGRLVGRKGTQAKEDETPLRPPPPDRQFELHVPFNIAKHHHDLYLVVKPGKSIVEMASGPRRRVSESINAAIDMAEARLLTVTAADEVELCEEQIAELKRLLADVLELEAEANALAPEVEYLWEADIPGIDDLAESIAEYGVAYGDEELTGVARLLTGQIQETEVQQTTPETFSYLGARRIGTTESFIGSFDDPDWNWRDFPSEPILRHPVNWWTAGGFNQQEFYVARPSGNYIYGGQTKGWDATKWRQHVMEDLLEPKKDAGISRIEARRQAVIKDFEDAGFTHLSWDDIWLEGGEGYGWQGHHVHEVSWGGPHHVSNIQYLKQPDHHPASSWWNRRRDDIKVNLNIPR